MYDRGSSQLTKQQLINQIARTRRANSRDRKNSAKMFRDQKVDIRGVDDRRGKNKAFRYLGSSGYVITRGHRKYV